MAACSLAPLAGCEAGGPAPAAPGPALGAAAMIDCLERVEIPEELAAPPALASGAQPPVAAAVSWPPVTAPPGDGGVEEGGPDAAAPAEDASVPAADASVPADGGAPSGDRDTFGVRMLHPTAPGQAAWTSLHWERGSRRQITGADPSDPTGWSRKRGTGTLEVDGRGVLTMSGSQPRLYLDGVPAKFWTNVEVTLYYRRVSDDGTAWGGAVIGTRSGRDGHTTGQSCTATTYYGRLRHDGRADFAKELQHPTAAARSSVSPFGGGRLPFNRWIGVKMVVRNQPDGSVKLEHYMDLTEGVNGGRWERINETTDAGGWVAGHSCGYARDLVVRQGGGVVFIRNTGVTRAEYKWVTVREIRS